jgi:hypothetical protein
MSKLIKFIVLLFIFYIGFCSLFCFLGSLFYLFVRKTDFAFLSLFLSAGMCIVSFILIKELIFILKEKNKNE